VSDSAELTRICRDPLGTAVSHRWPSLVAGVVPIDLENAEDLRLPVTIGVNSASDGAVDTASSGEQRDGEGEFAVFGSKMCFSDWKGRKAVGLLVSRRSGTPGSCLTE